MEIKEGEEMWKLREEKERKGKKHTGVLVCLRILESFPRCAHASEHP